MKVKLGIITGNFYNEELIYNLKDKSITNRLYGYLNASDNYNISDITFIVKDVEIIDEIIYGDIEILNTPNGELLRTLIINGLYFFIFFYGVYEDAELKDISFFMIDTCPEKYGVQLHDLILIERKNKIEKIKNKINGLQ